MQNDDTFSYRVIWSDGTSMSACVPSSRPCRGSRTPEAAGWRIRAVVADVVAEMQASGEVPHLIFKDLTPNSCCSPSTSAPPFRVYRLARADHRLGTVDIKAGDTVIAALGSATQANRPSTTSPSAATAWTPRRPPHACRGMAWAWGDAGRGGTLKPTRVAGEFVFGCVGSLPS